MKSIILHSSFFIAVTAALAAAADPATNAPAAAAVEPAKPTALAAIERTTELYDRYGASFVEVAWKLKRDSEGRSPMRAIPYRCPNCGNVHYRNFDSMLAENRAFATPGFALAENRFLAYDPKIRTAGVERVEIRLPQRPGEGFAARVVESYPEQGALLFETDEPLPGVKPLEFAAAGEMPDEPAYFFVVREDAMLTTGVRTKPVDAFTRYLDVGKDYLRGVENALLLNASNEAVTVCFQGAFEVGKGCFEAPSAWTRGEPDAAEREAEALEARLARGILPVFMRLDPKAQEERGGSRSRVYYSSDEEEGNGDEKDLAGIVFEGGVVVIPTGAGADEIARLDKLEATLPDGTKAPLEFAGACKDFKVVYARFAGGAVPAGVEPIRVAGGPILARYRQPALDADVELRGDSLRIRAGHRRLDSFSLGRDDRPQADAGESGSDLFTPAGEMVQYFTDRRQSRSRWGGGEHDAFSGERLAEFAAGKAELDPEIVPRKGKDRIRVAWFGVDLQTVTHEVAREKKALAWLGSKRDRDVDTMGALVNHVYPGGTAEKIGVKEGDILLFARSADGSVRRAIEKRDGFERDIDWDEIYEEAPVQLFDRIDFTPWPAVGNAADEALTGFGIGASVAVEWVSDGELRQAAFDVAVAPPHYRTATRARSKALGIIVADATFEVREYFKLGADEGGVVVAKCKNGSPAAIAGLRPFELVTKVDDTPVSDVRGFLDAVRGKESLTITARRLTATRVVRIALKGGAAKDESAEDAAEDAPAEEAE